MASIVIPGISNTYSNTSNADKINVEAAYIIIGNTVVSANNPLPTTGGGGGSSGGNGSVTAAGNNGTVAQAVQGIANGVPVAVLLSNNNANNPVYVIGNTGGFSSNSTNPVYVSPSNGAVFWQNVQPVIISNNSLTNTIFTTIVNNTGNNVSNPTYTQPPTGNSISPTYVLVSNNNANNPLFTQSSGGNANNPIYILISNNNANNATYAQITNFPNTQLVVQGLANTANNSWPVYLTQSNLAISNTNPLAITGNVVISNTILSSYMSISANAGGVNNFSRMQSSANSNNLTTAKAAAGRVMKIVGYNTNTAVLRLRFYNNSTNTGVTVGTTNTYFSRPLPSGTFSFDMGDIGWSFSNGITYGFTTNALDTDTSGIAAGAITDFSIEYV